MTVELTHKDLITLVKGTGGPGSYILPTYLTGFGELRGFPNERWYWNNSALNNCTDEQLWELYNKLKH